MTDFSWKERLKFTLIGLLIVGIFILGILEFKWIQNMLNPKMFLGIFVLVGLIIGSVVGHSFAKKTKDDVDKMRFYLIFATIGICCLPILGSKTNRLLSFSNYENKAVELYEQKGYIADIGIIEGQSMKPDGYFTFVLLDGEMQRFKSEQPLFPNAKKGDMVDLKMKRGIFGFWIIKME